MNESSSGTISTSSSTTRIMTTANSAISRIEHTLLAKKPLVSTTTSTSTSIDKKGAQIFRQFKQMTGDANVNANANANTNTNVNVNVNANSTVSPIRSSGTSTNHLANPLVAGKKRKFKQGSHGSNNVNVNVNAKDGDNNDDNNDNNNDDKSISNSSKSSDGVDYDSSDDEFHSKPTYKRSRASSEADISQQTTSQSQPCSPIEQQNQQQQQPQFQQQSQQQPQQKFQQQQQSQQQQQQPQQQQTLVTNIDNPIFVQQIDETIKIQKNNPIDPTAPQRNQIGKNSSSNHNNQLEYIAKGQNKKCDSITPIEHNKDANKCTIASTSTSTIANHIRVPLHWENNETQMETNNNNNANTNNNNNNKSSNHNIDHGYDHRKIQVLKDEEEKKRTLTTQKTSEVEHVTPTAIPIPIPIPIPRESIIEGEDEYSKFTEKVRVNDVFLGNKKFAKYKGNTIFTVYIRNHISIYMRSTDEIKDTFPQHVYETITKKLSPGGRFLKYNTTNPRFWYILSEGESINFIKTTFSKTYDVLKAKERKGLQVLKNTYTDTNVSSESSKSYKNYKVMNIKNPKKSEEALPCSEGISNIPTSPITHNNDHPLKNIVKNTGGKESSSEASSIINTIHKSKPTCTSISALKQSSTVSPEDTNDSESIKSDNSSTSISNKGPLEAIITTSPNKKKSISASVKLKSANATSIPKMRTKKNKIRKKRTYANMNNNNSDDEQLLPSELALLLQNPHLMKPPHVDTTEIGTASSKNVTPPSPSSSPVLPLSQSQSQWLSTSSSTSSLLSSSSSPLLSSSPLRPTSPVQLSPFMIRCHDGNETGDIQESTSLSCSYSYNPNMTTNINNAISNNTATAMAIAMATNVNTNRNTNTNSTDDEIQRAERLWEIIPEPHHTYPERVEAIRIKATHFRQILNNIQQISHGSSTTTTTSSSSNNNDNDNNAEEEEKESDQGLKSEQDDIIRQKMIKEIEEMIIEEEKIWGIIPSTSTLTSNHELTLVERVEVISSFSKSLMERVRLIL